MIKNTGELLNLISSNYNTIKQRPVFFQFITIFDQIGVEKLQNLLVV